MLEFIAVHKSFRGPQGRVQVLSDFSMRIQAGEFVAVQGSSGSGKTTLLLSAGGMLQPDSGRIHLEGTDLYALSAEARAAVRARSVGFVFQQFHLIPYLSVLENVLTASMAAAVESPRSRALDLLAGLNLTHRLDHRPGQLSTGERQRVAMARAMLNQPKIVLADEPTGNLDATHGAHVLDYLQRFAEVGGMVLIATHDMQIARRAGRLIRIASPL